MSSHGFDTMPSRITQFLHPAVDPTDRYDPTFIGVQRKAKVVPQLTAQNVEKGKRILAEKQAHDQTVLQQQRQAFIEPAFRSDVESHRFGAGFARRNQSQIQQDRQRLLKDTEEAQRHEGQAAARRVSLASRNFAQYDIITGLPASITQHYPTAKPTPSDRIEPLHRKMDWPESRKSSVFPRATQRQHDSSYRSPLLDASGAAVPQNARQDRLIHDGLTATKREWSVAQQLKCGDGYVLPKITAV